MKTSTKIEIEEGNCKIAEYTGKKLIRADDFNKLGEASYTGDNANVSWGIIEYLKYHKSWDWIMPVVIQINSTHNQVDGRILIGRDIMYTLRHLLGSGYGFTEYKREQLPMTVENVWIRSVEYIKYLNKNQKPRKMKELAIRILNFLDTYAAISPNWDKESDDGKYTCPDAYQLKVCAEMIEKEMKPLRCWSEWGSGGYKPYSSREGREEHDYLVTEIYKIINS